MNNNSRKLSWRTLCFIQSMIRLHIQARKRVSECEFETAKTINETAADCYLFAAKHAANWHSTI